MKPERRSTVWVVLAVLGLSAIMLLVAVFMLGICAVIGYLFFGQQLR